MYHISSFHYLSCRLKKNINKSRSAQNQDRPALPFLGLSEPHPEAPRGQEKSTPSSPFPVLGLRLGQTEADPRPGHTICHV